jgi:hypothetical protein
VTAVTEASELSVSEKPHLPGDPTIAVLAVGSGHQDDAFIDPRWSMYVSRYQMQQLGVVPMPETAKKPELVGAAR